MSKTRATTMQQRLGFADGDLTTSKHDEMMLWLDANVKSIFPTIVLGYYLRSSLGFRH